LARQTKAGNTFVLHRALSAWTVALQTRRTAADDIPALTGLRGFAAVLVVVYHYAASPHLAQPYTPIGPGYLGVDVFFVLSGFLMALNYGEGFRRGFSRAAYRNFLGKRLARIYPLYLFATLGVFVLGMAGFAAGAHSVANLIGNLSLAESWGLGRLPGLSWLTAPLVGPAWSISTEAAAYLLFPALVAMAVYRSKTSAALAGAVSFAALILLVAMPAAWKAQAFPARGPLDISNGADVWPLVRCLADFTIGLLAWRLRPAILPTLKGGLGWALLATAAALWFVPYRDLAMVPVVALLIIALSDTTARVARVFANRIAVFFGNISYALYLLHFPVLFIIGPSVAKRLGALGDDAHLATLLILGGLDIALAWLSFRFVEAPSRRLVRNLLEPRRRLGPISEEPSAP
jgi:peptidoglycan/LPS O-acetylase OafA/YrhL